MTNEHEHMHLSLPMPCRNGVDSRACEEEPATVFVLVMTQPPMVNQLPFPHIVRTAHFQRLARRTIGWHSLEQTIFVVLLRSYILSVFQFFSCFIFIFLLVAFFLILNIFSIKACSKPQIFVFFSFRFDFVEHSSLTTFLPVCRHVGLCVTVSRCGRFSGNGRFSWAALCFLLD